MLWNLIYDFFVNLFGGIDSNGAYIETAKIGVTWDDGMPDGGFTYSINALTLYDFGGNPIYIDLGSYLSLIATIISMVAIVLICCALIKKIYNMCAHIIG